MTQELKLIAPDVFVLPFAFQLAGQENPRLAEVVTDILPSCNVIVDATANANAFVTLAAICKKANSTLIWGELFAGGGGALMARSRGGVDADALSVRSHILGCLESFPPAPDKKATGYDVLAEEQVVVAGDAEVSALAASMAQFALDALCREPEKSEFPFSAYLMGYKKYWVFEQPFMTIPIACPAAQAADSSGSVMTEEQQVALDAFAAQIEVVPGAADNNTK